MEADRRPLTRRAAFRLTGAAALLAAVGLTARAVLDRSDVDAYHPENERYFAAVKVDPQSYHRNPTVDDAVREADAVVVGEVVDVRILGVTVGETADLVAPAYGYGVRVDKVLHGSLRASDRERLTVLLQAAMLGSLAEPGSRLETAPRGLGTWILRSNRSSAEDTGRTMRERGDSSDQIAEFLRWYSPAYLPAGAVQGILMQGRHHVQSPLDDNPGTALAADAARYSKLSELNSAIEKMG